MTKKIFAGRVTTPGAGRVTVAELVGFYNPAARHVFRDIFDMSYE